MRRALAACAAVLGASLVSLVFTRLLMRAVALIVNTRPHFTVAALGLIFLLYVLALGPGAIALSIASRWWCKLLYGVGVLLLAYSAVNIGVQETAAGRDMTTLRWLLFILVLVAMVAVYTGQSIFVWRAANRARTGNSVPT